MLISATAAASANALNGVGGGNMRGTSGSERMLLEGGCSFRNASDTRLRSSSSPPAYPMAYTTRLPKADPADAIVT